MFFSDYTGIIMFYYKKDMSDRAFASTSLGLVCERRIDRLIIEFHHFDGYDTA